MYCDVSRAKYIYLSKLHGIGCPLIRSSFSNQRDWILVPPSYETMSLRHDQTNIRMLFEVVTLTYKNCG